MIPNEQKKTREDVNIPFLMIFGKFMFFHPNTKNSGNEFGIFYPEFRFLPSMWRIDSYCWNDLGPTHLKKTSDAFIMWGWDLVSREVRSYKVGMRNYKHKMCDEPEFLGKSRLKIFTKKYSRRIYRYWINIMRIIFLILIKYQNTALYVPSN